MNFQTPGTSIVINKLLLQETGTYNVMHHRPYQTVITPHDLNNITQRLHDNNNQTVTGTLLAGIASNIIAPSATPQGAIIIPNGWNERRIRFVMEVTAFTSTGNTIVYYFQGFTSHLGVTPNGAIDPNMEFYINSFIRVNRLMQNTPYGTVMKDIVTESAHILNGRIHSNTNNVSPEAQYIMRPQDIFHGIQSNYLSNAYKMNSPNDLIDTRITLNSSESLRSKRANNLSTKYLASIVDSYQNGIKLAEFGQDDSDILSRCSSLVIEEPTAENIFIRAINNVKGYISGGAFTISDLEKIDVNVKNVAKYITLGPVQVNQLHNTGQTAYWNASDRETLASTMLANSVPAIMMELMISKIYFRSTNNSLGGVVTTIIIDAKSLTEADISQNYEIFKLRLEREVLYDITYSNQDIYMLEMQVDLFGETKINISLGNNPITPYTVPSFCDALSVPVLATDKNSYNTVIHDFEVLMNNINTSNNNSNMTVNNLI